ncbi:MAG: sigma 54-interacting transcriptional regulator [Thermoanaerobaculia bacterium]
MESSSEHACERYPLSAARETWREFAALEHETLPIPRDFAADGEVLIVERALPRGRPIAAGRIPATFGPSLFLQAASAVSFFHAAGFFMDPEDLLDARWHARSGTPRLQLARSPAGVRQNGAPRSPAEALAPFARSLFFRGRRLAVPAAGALIEELDAPGGPGRRADFWLATAYRAFPALSLAESAPSRLRTLGHGGAYFRDVGRRALVAKARAVLSGRAVRIFSFGSALEPASALGFEDPPRGAVEAARRLRQRHAREAGGVRAVWIATEPNRWDALSRKAFQTALRSLHGEVEALEIPTELPPPRLPDEWRREVFVPCGSLAASLRFYESLAERARGSPRSGLHLVRAAVASTAWAGFAGDPTGDATPPIPAAEEAEDRPAAPMPKGSRASRAEAEPARRVENALSAGHVARALDEGRRWIEGLPGASPDYWFELSARLGRAAGDAAPPWLSLLEAEREIAGGRLREAQARLESVARNETAQSDERRAAGLRLAETAVARGDMGAAVALAVRWRREFAGAPPAERSRALRVEAAGRARAGEHALALRLLDQADRQAIGLALSGRLENALARATVLSLQGRFDDEKALYEAWRPAVTRSGDETLMARLLAREALGLSDRREYAAAAARLEQASEVLRDDPVERARVLIDLAATFYHSGRTGRCEGLLEEAIACAALAGREDLSRTARANRLEVLINRCEWSRAAAEAQALAAAARQEGDELRRLVAMHQSSRLALRTGDLERAARENAEARVIAETLRDRLEIGELWLEEGDRLVYAGDVEGARRAYGMAAADPPDRCETERVARERLAEMENPDPGEEKNSALDELFRRDAYSAAESLARRHALLRASGGGLAPAWRSRTEQVLRSQGGSALADAVFGPRGGRADASLTTGLRALRASVARALAGEDAEAALAPLGLQALEIRDGGGRVLARLAETPAPPAESSAQRSLHAGNMSYRLEVWPQPPQDRMEAVVLVLETLLFRIPPAPALGEHSAGWSRLGIVSADASMEEPYRRLSLFAAQHVTVLVLGESGTGKEAVARAVHSLSARATRPFIAVNVAAIPSPLLESELFGHARGAFTGADRERRGLIEDANCGTIFFDEIGDLALPLQAKLLRALQEREIRRVGETRPRKVDVRVVSATARDLSREVQAGRFREDLYYRLHVAVIPLPPLRRRGRDVFLIARHFLDLYAREYARGRLQFAPEALAAIGSHQWPGNVRELQNAVAQAAALAAPDGLVTLDMLPEPIRRARGAPADTVDYRARVDAHRRDLICEALERTGGNRSRAARDLGLSRQALLYLIRELRIPAPRRTRGQI